MELLLARKNIHYFVINDDANTPVQFIFTDKMIENNLFIQLKETSFEIDSDDSDDEEFEDEEEEEDDQDEDDDAGLPRSHNDAIEQAQETEKFDETIITLSAIIDNTGMDYFIFIEPSVDVGRLILYRQLLDLIEIVDNCTQEQLHSYLQQAAISYFSGKQVKQFNRERNITRDMIKMIALLRDLRDQKMRIKN